MSGKTPIDLYAGIANRYDLSVESIGDYDTGVIAFFRRLFSENDVHSVLDCACGTGRHLLLFHDLGCQVYGSDVSASMLAQAHKNMISRGVEISLQRVDYRCLSLHFDRKFDAVVCLAAIGFMLDESECLRAFRSMKDILHENGILVLTSIPTDKQWKEQPRFSLVANREDFSRLFVIDYFERKAMYHILDIFHSQVANKLEVWSVELTVVLMDDQERLLKEAGFRKIDFYGDFDFTPYDKMTSERLITVAHK